MAGKWVWWSFRQNSGPTCCICQKFTSAWNAEPTCKSCFEIVKTHGGLVTDEKDKHEVPGDVEDKKAEKGKKDKKEKKEVRGTTSSASSSKPKKAGKK